MVSKRRQLSIYQSYVDQFHGVTEDERFEYQTQRKARRTPDTRLIRLTFIKKSRVVMIKQKEKKKKQEKKLTSS